jgi:hypothetical protein
MKELRRAVIREFICACHEGVLDDDRCRRFDPGGPWTDE